MSARLIKNVQSRVQDGLKRTATASRRSMAQQETHSLEWRMTATATKPAFPAPIHLHGNPLTLAEIDAAKETGRR